MATNHKSCTDAVTSVKQECASKGSNACQLCDPSVDCAKPADPARADFRVTPLSYFTADGRNDRFFTANTYGLRIAWVMSPPPADHFSIDGVATQWAKQGAFDPKKEGWNGDHPYAFTDLAVAVGQRKIAVGAFTYNVRVPGAGTADDDVIVFIGDPDVDDPDGWSLGGAGGVMVDVFEQRASDARLVVFLGDTFYKNDSNGIQTSWAKLSVNVHTNAISSRPITDFLTVGIIGNHDYQAETGCGACNWTWSNTSCLETPDAKASAAWMPYFFSQDGVTSSFEAGLSATYRNSCRVPIAFTFSAYVVGRSCLVTFDGAWSPRDVPDDVWRNLEKRVAAVVDRVLICGHFSSGDGGGKDGTTQIWVNHVKQELQLFKNHAIVGVQGHNHQNVGAAGLARPGQVPFSLVTVGGNGYKGAGCGCTGVCRGCDCCCPSLYKSGQFTLGGWSNGGLCSGLPGASQTVATTNAAVLARKQWQRQQLENVNARNHEPFTDAEVFQWYDPSLRDFAPYPRNPAYAAFEVPPTMNPGEASPPYERDELGMLPAELHQPFARYYNFKAGYPECSDKLNTSAAGYTCWQPGQPSPEVVFDLPKPQSVRLEA